MNNVTIYRQYFLRLSGRLPLNLPTRARSLPLLTLAMLTLASVTTASATDLEGDIDGCFVAGVLDPETKQKSISRPTTKVFKNAFDTPVTVTCPLNSHPALAIDGVTINIVNLPRPTSNRFDTTVTTGTAVSCALMTRSTAGGQATGRRIYTTTAGLMYLPEADSLASKGIAPANPGLEARYRYIQCDLAAYTGIAGYATRIQSGGTTATEPDRLHELVNSETPNETGEFIRLGRKTKNNNADLLPTLHELLEK